MVYNQISEGLGIIKGCFLCTCIELCGNLFHFYWKSLPIAKAALVDEAVSRVRLMDFL